MSLGTKCLGQWGEDVAAAYLGAAGYRIIARNVRARPGELDIVAQIRGLLVFVEVKTRSGAGFGSGAEAVGTRKLGHLARAAEHYRQRAHHTGPWRIDVIVIELRESGEPTITHLENVTVGMFE